MNFLSKTLSSFTGSLIPYTIGEEIVVPPETSLVWKLYRGSNPKTDNSPVTIFEFNLRDPANIQRNYVALARNAFKKTKLIKFPGIVAVVDFVETDSHLYIITESVSPLRAHLPNDPSLDVKLAGIYSIAKTLEFINFKCQCLHGSLTVDSVFVNEKGDWKLFGFELLTNLTSDPDQPIYRLSLALPLFSENLPEDVATQGVEAIRSFPVKFDSYRLGAFIHHLFDTGPVSVPLLLPRELASPHKRLISNKANLRITIEKFLQDTNSYFASNTYISFNKKLEDLQFESDLEKLLFFKYELTTYIDDENETNWPQGFLHHKVLPELINQYSRLLKPSTEDAQLRQETVSILLNYIIKFGTELAPAEFNKSVKPLVLSAFASPDRSVRLTLLNHLPSYSKFMTEGDVQQKVFYSVISGFQDTNFMIRESTLRSITEIIDKVSVKQVNQDLLKVLAKLQMDPKPSIRVNTLVLIIRISSKIYGTSKNNVLITALSKSLRDTFVPAKIMALSGFERLIDEFSLEEICSKILGHLAISLMDSKSHKVRVEAKRIFELYLESVERHASTLPETEEDEDAEEKEFFKRYAPAASKATVSDVAPETENGGLFGWGLNKLVSSTIKGELDNDMNRPTPDITRVATPTMKPSAVPPAGPEIKSADLWNFDEWDDAVPDISASDGAAPVLAKAAPKLPPKVSQPATRKPSTLKLGKKSPRQPGLSLKLNLTVDSNDDWGDSAW